LKKYIADRRRFFRASKDFAARGIGREPAKQRVARAPAYDVQSPQIPAENLSELIQCRAVGEGQALEDRPRESSLIFRDRLARPAAESDDFARHNAGSQEHRVVGID